MARPLRRNYPGAVQHIAVNGNNRQPMFADDGDRRLCIALLAQTAVRYQWELRSYCLMDTHWHAVVRTPLGNLPGGMQRMNTAYSRMFNHRHQRSGHSIRHRYMSVPVEDNGHLLELTRYIPLNPVRGGSSRIRRTGAGSTWSGPRSNVPGNGSKYSALIRYSSWTMRSASIPSKIAGRSGATHWCGRHTPCKSRNHFSAQPLRPRCSP